MAIESVVDHNTRSRRALSFRGWRGDRILVGPSLTENPAGTTLGTLYDFPHELEGRF